VIIGDSVDNTKVCEVVFEGRVIAVPGNDIERRVILLCGKQPAPEFADDGEFNILVLICRHRGEKVSRVSQAIRTYDIIETLRGGSEGKKGKDYQLDRDRAVQNGRRIPPRDILL